MGRRRRTEEGEGGGGRFRDFRKQLGKLGIFFLGIFGLVWFVEEDEEDLGVLIFFF